MPSNLNIALVHDALPFVGGAEKLLEAVVELFPKAPLYTLVYNPKPFTGWRLAKHPIRTSFINKFPGAQRNHYRYFPLFPFAIGQFDLSQYDIVLSFSYAVAHGVHTHPGQVHISLTHTPLRYAWSQERVNSRGRLNAWPLTLFWQLLRRWDVAAARRVDEFIAVSSWVSALIWRAYHRPSQVIYPPVDIEKFQPINPRKEHYIAVSRLVPHKRVDLIVDAFSHLRLPLFVVGDGQEYSHLSRIAPPNITFLGWQPDEKLRYLLGTAKAFVHAAEEEFGISLVEAQAAGCPVIAYAHGGAAETVLDGQTGILFREQSVASLMEAVEYFELGGLRCRPADLRANAERFNKSRFQTAFWNLVMEKSCLLSGNTGVLQNETILAG